uniref:Uncharacterized protein n=1 Tax=Cannabis sativa TaxID=3483 RepID=A0A803Q8C5_CANSA
EAVIGGGEKKLHKKNPVAHDGKNRRALGDIGNMVPAARGGVEGKPNHPMTRFFSLSLYARAAEKNKKQMVVPDDGRRIEALEANKINKIVNVKPKPIEAIDLSSNTEKVKKKPEKPLNNMEKEVEAQIVDIHATDVDNKLERQIDTVVELQFPIGINSDRFVRALKIPEVQEHMKELKERFAGRKVD